jgi:hypothetical protein
MFMPFRCDEAKYDLQVWSQQSVQEYQALARVEADTLGSDKCKG